MSASHLVVIFKTMSASHLVVIFNRHERKKANRKKEKPDVQNKQIHNYVSQKGNYGVISIL